MPETYYRLTCLGGEVRFMPGQVPAGITIGGMTYRRPVIKAGEKVLVGLVVADLDFADKPFCPNLNIYIGAEWHGAKPLWQAPQQPPSRRGQWDTTRFEVWALGPGDKLLLSDSNKAIRRLTLNREGKPVLGTVTAKDMAAYLHERGNNAVASNSDPSLRWVINSLRTLARHFREVRDDSACRQRLDEFVATLAKLPPRKQG